MAKKKLGSTKLTDELLVTSVALNDSAQVTGTLPFANGGTGQTSYTDGQLLIGNTSTGGLSKATLTQGTGITITNGSGTITIASTATGTVNSGTINQLAYYAATGSAVSGLATANNGVLVTSGAGAPSISSDLPTAVTIGTAYIYRAGGTDVSVADGGTGLSSGTSGGIPFFSSGTAMTSSSLLAANTVLVGGGAGTAPRSIASAGTANQFLVSNGAGIDPTWSFVNTSNVATAMQDLFARIDMVVSIPETSNVVQVTGTVENLNGSAILSTATVVKITVSDLSTECDPSATATLTAGTNIKGAILAGSGTATLIMTPAAADGKFNLNVNETAAGNRFLWVEGGPGSQTFVRAKAGALQCTFA